MMNMVHRNGAAVPPMSPAGRDFLNRVHCFSSMLANPKVFLADAGIGPEKPSDPRPGMGQFSWSTEFRRIHGSCLRRPPARSFRRPRLTPPCRCLVSVPPHPARLFVRKLVNSAPPSKRWAGQPAAELLADAQGPEGAALIVRTQRPPPSPGA